MKPISAEPLLASMTSDIETNIQQTIASRNIGPPLMIGIHTGGAWFAHRLHQKLGLESSLGLLDISFYRDDFSRVGLNPKVKSSNLPESVEGRAVLLVDDVLHTGRTVRAALNEIFSYGRPALVRLIVALERPGRELPVAADIIGQSLDLSADQQAKLTERDGSMFFDIVATRIRDQL